MQSRAWDASLARLPRGRRGGRDQLTPFRRAHGNNVNDAACRGLQRICCEPSRNLQVARASGAFGSCKIVTRTGGNGPTPYEQERVRLRTPAAAGRHPWLQRPGAADALRWLALLRTVGPGWVRGVRTAPWHGRRLRRSGLRRSRPAEADEPVRPVPVSYTHLTLPTI